MNHTQPRPTDDQPTCPGKGMLAGYSLGTLPWSDLDRVSGHLDGCPKCLETLQSLDSSADDLVVRLREQPWDRPVNVEDTRWLVENLKCLLIRPSALAAREPLTQIGPYRILEVVGEGGMGTVYRARHVHLARIVAIKVLAPGRLADPEAVTRFTREMKAIGQLSHPHIVQAFDANLGEVPYLAMELIEGADLSRLVKQRGRLGVAEGCECIRQAALGLQHAHEAGLVHRDIKPSNLMVTPQGHVKILDLGLARLVPELPATTDTESGWGSITEDAMIGTLDYIAPEQIRRSHEVDIRADLYALGCTLFYLLAGRPPFGDYPDLTKRDVHLTVPAPDLREFCPDVPPGLARLVDQLLAKDPEQRPDTPANLAAALLPFVTGANLGALFQTTAPGPTPGLPAATASRRSVPRSVPRSASKGRGGRGLLAAWMLGGGAVLATFVLGAVWLSHWRDDSDRPEPADTRHSLITTLAVGQFRTEGRLVRLGEVGQDGVPAPTLADSFRVKIRLREPAYCYLIAFGPDARDILCFPPHPNDAPNRTQEVRYPAETYTRPDKPGLYAFVVLASREPLPPYAVWKERLPAFRPQPGAPQGIWEFDGQQVVTLRAEGENLNRPILPSFVRELGTALSSNPAHTVRVLAFSVR